MVTVRSVKVSIIDAAVEYSINNTVLINSVESFACLSI